MTTQLHNNSLANIEEVQQTNSQISCKQIPKQGTNFVAELYTNWYTWTIISCIENL